MSVRNLAAVVLVVLTRVLAFLSTTTVVPSEHRANLRA